MRNDALCCMQHAATRPALRVLHAGTSIGESSFITPALRCVRACPKLQPEHPVHSAIRQLHTGGSAGHGPCGRASLGTLAFRKPDLTLYRLVISPGLHKQHPIVALPPPLRPNMDTGVHTNPGTHTVYGVQ